MPEQREQWLKTPVFSRTAKVAIAVVLVMAVLLLMAKGYAIRSAYETAISRGERDTLSAATILAEHAQRTFEGVSRALKEASELRVSVDAGLLAGAAEVHEALKTIREDSPAIQAIGWSDAAGNQAASSTYRDPPALNIADQSQFSVHRDDPAAGLHLAGPIRSRVDGAWIIPVSRRFEDAGGRFDGIVNAVLRLDYFRDFYRAIYLGADTVVLLARRDGVLLTGTAALDEWVGRPLPSAPMFQALPRDVRPTALQMTTGVDGMERIVGYRAVPGTELVVVSTMSRWDTLASFREVLVASTIEGALMIVGLAIGGVLLVVVIRRRDAATDQLEEIGTLLRMVFATTHQAICVFDRDLRAVAWNELYESLLGGADGLSEGTTFESVLRGMVAAGEHGTEDAETFVAERLKMARAGLPLRYERTRPNGAVIDVSWLPLPNGFLAISLTDITYLKQTEAALRESEAQAERAHARLRDAVESLADPFFLWDADERLVVVNSAAVKSDGGEALVPGVRLEDAITRHVRSGRYPAAAGREDDYIRERLAQIRGATGEPREVERADGRWLATWDHRTGEGGIVSLRVDITNLKRAEIALRESEARAAQAHGRLSDAIESLPLVFMLWDADERLVLYNAGAAATLSLAASDDGEALKAGISFEEASRRHVRAGRIPAAVGREEEYVADRLAEFRRGTGERVEVQLADGRWLAMHDRRTREGGTVSLRIDITESKTRETELRAARAVAEHASEVKSTFLANMSHEIRTPLGGIIGYANLLLATDLDAQRADWTRKLKSAGDQLLAVINDILDYSKLEAGDFTIDPKPTPLAVIVDEVYSMMSEAAQARGLVLRHEFGVDLPKLIRVDPVRLKQILMNLLSNAIKFTDRGGVTVTVSATGETPPVFAIAVADTGIGIPRAKLPTIFERFTQAETNISRGRGGTGLGLSISRRLAELMGGSLTLESEEGRGTTVHLRLPLDTAPETAPVPSPAVRAARTGRILLVDDLAMNLEIGEAMLRARGHEVRTAMSGLEAIDLVMEETFDVILLDINLPDLDGYEVARAMRSSEPPGRRTPIFALTANALPEQIAQALASGMDGHIAKPIDERRLDDHLASVLAPGAVSSAPAHARDDLRPLVDTLAADTLRRLVGAERLRSLDGDFWAIWRVFNDGVVSQAEDRAWLMTMSHDLVSLAANIGYLRLADACRSLSHLASNDAADIGPAIGRTIEIGEETRRAAQG